MASYILKVWIGACVIGFCLTGQPGIASTTPEPNKQVEIIPTDGCNMKIVDQLDSHFIITQVDPPVHNWFAGRFTNLPIDKEVTISLRLENAVGAVNVADVTKWRGLKPVMTYANPNKYDSYEWFRKDENGRWISGDPFKSGEVKYAGTGKVPIQSVIPVQVAEEFLSTDGKYWQPWREISSVEAIPATNTMRIKHHFELSEATIAMRIPYTYTYQQSMMEKIKAAKFPGVCIDTIGITQEGRDIQIIRIDDPKNPLRLSVQRVITGPPYISFNNFIVTPPGRINSSDRRVIVMTAREHATEQASSWVLIGALNNLIHSNTQEISEERYKTYWLFIPMIDFDGSVHSKFDSLTDRYKYSTSIPVECAIYMRYLRSYIEAGYPIVLTSSWHNIECAEGPNISSPYALRQDEELTTTFNKLFFNSLKDLLVVPTTYSAQESGNIFSRLYSCCAKNYSSFALSFEINDRYPPRTLSLEQIQHVGAEFVPSIYGFVSQNSDMNMKIANIEMLLRKRIDCEKVYYSSQHHSGTIDNPSLLELFIGL